MPTMLILRGNSGRFPDEDGNPKDYPKGALHEAAATQYAHRVGFSGEVLDISGDRGGSSRSRSPQTIFALEKFQRRDDVTAFYGFSGGGYNVYWILQALSETERRRLTWIAVLGAPETAKAKYEATAYPGGSWTLVYQLDPPLSVAPKGKGLKDAHMFGPDWLLSKTAAPPATTP
ncbi:hypothetical protein [Methylobacterium trifolii]|uniref:Alpha/beta hydrolase n=1 Tax=Methylobacterium trifolii TaxID=1003092 RepID=A0ABQ4U4C1_9HYPH|nr:hypothetical protein [Methylobacterium trifolii]GJE61677.1 hypothetical protein MPOCJGCO_3800 [Methylobacterium trifolii]